MSARGPAPSASPKSRLWRTGATLAYLCLAVCGGIITVLCLTSPSPNNPEWWVLLALAIGTALPGLVCAAGVTFGKYRWEWVGTAPLASGIGILAAFEWVAATDAWGAANALLATSFALWIGGRCLKIGLADREARREVLRDIAEEARNG